MEKLRILIFEPYPSVRMSGNLRTLSYILKFVDPREVDLHVVVPYVSPLIEVLHSQDVRRTVVPGGQRLTRYGGRCLRDGLVGRIGTIISVIRYNLAICSFMREHRIDVVYCNSIRAVLLVGLAAKLSRRPLLWYVKGELQNPLLDRIGFHLADRILFQCESNKRDKYPRLIARLGQKVGLLKSGVDREIILQVENKNKKPLIEELGVNLDRIQVAILGQLHEPKGVHHLMEAVAKIVPKFSNFSVYLVGDHGIEEHASYKATLEEVIEKHGIQEFVRFTGWRTDALEILSVMDILVHPSLSEGFPRAVLEAMALGKAVVASRVGGLRELIVDGENGCLVDPGDVDSLADKLRLLMEHRSLRVRLGQAARMKVFSEHLIKDKVEQLQTIWKDMGRARSAM